MALEQSEAIKALVRISDYLREIASFNRRSDLARVLQDPEQRRAYDLSDGTRSSEEIASDGAVGKSARTVRRWWNDWREKGLIDDDGSEHPRNRYATFVLDLENGE